MKTYLRLYRWSMQMKLHMALYTFAAVFFKIVCNLFQGIHQIDMGWFLWCLPCWKPPSSLKTLSVPKDVPCSGWSQPTFALWTELGCLAGFRISLSGEVFC